MPLKLVPPSIEGVLVRLMQKWRSFRPSASIEEWRKILNDLVAGERAALCIDCGKLGYVTAWGRWCFEYNVERMTRLDKRFEKMDEILKARGEE
jgi:hypothetical protein